MSKIVVVPGSTVDRIKFIADFLQHHTVVAESLRLGKPPLPGAQRPFVDIAERDNVFAHYALTVRSSLATRTNHTDIKLFVWRNLAPEERTAGQDQGAGN